MIAAHAEFDQYLEILVSNSAVSHTIAEKNYRQLLQETARFIAVHHFWTRYWLGRSSWHEKITELVWSTFLQIVLTLVCISNNPVVAILVFILASGVLKGFDPLLNLVLDGTTEHLRGTVLVLCLLNFTRLFACIHHLLLH